MLMRFISTLKVEEKKVLIRQTPLLMVGLTHEALNPLLLVILRFQQMMVYVVQRYAPIRVLILLFQLQ